MFITLNTSFCLGILNHPHVVTLRGEPEVTFSVRTARGALCNGAVSPG